MGRFKPVEDRRVEFLHSLVDLCKKYKVGLTVDWDSLECVPEDQLPTFTENGGSQFNFLVSLADLEQQIRLMGE